MREAVVLVHGIWMRGGSLFIIARCLQSGGFNCYPFTYASVRRTAAQNAERLHAFSSGLEADIVHFVGHSLGGIVILHLFDRYPRQRPGRVVFAGSPVNGSAVAQRSAANPISQVLLGNSLRRALMGGTPAWRGARDLGVIAGSRSLGVGRLLGGLRGTNDGTVSVDETRIPGATDHIVLPVTHTGLVISRAVADQVQAFLRNGEFMR
ncbi:MAG: alpha/beta hydrolase [Gammaproteobacteria bacterium]|nr:alpha/beta hydrolase [Gammaproteobacteria bacterium]